MSTTKPRPSNTFFDRTIENFGKMSGVLLIALLVGVMAFAAVYVIGLALELDDPFEEAVDAMRIIGFLAFLFPLGEFLVEGISLAWHRGKRRAEGGE